MLEVIKNRRACRQFDASKMVEDNKIDEIIKAGLLAPSGMNRQTPVIIAIKEKETRDRLMELNREIGGGFFHGDTDPFYHAPVVILVIAHKNGLSLQDGGACMENMLLEATNQGLCSCWIHRADEEIKSIKGREILSFTGLNFDDYVGIGHAIIGYPVEGFKPIDKKINDNRVFIK